MSSGISCSVDGSILCKCNASYNDDDISNQEYFGLLVLCRPSKARNLTPFENVKKGKFEFRWIIEVPVFNIHESAIRLVEVPTITKSSPLGLIILRWAIVPILIHSKEYTLQ